MRLPYTYNLSGTGEYLLGAVGTVTTYNYKNSSYQNASSTVNAYQWWDSAVQSAITYKPDTSKSTTYTTTFTLDGQGVLTNAYIGDGRPRSIVFRTNGDGQMIRRDETDNNYNATTGGDPHEIWYRFGGVELGYVGNNGTSQTSTPTSIGDRRTNPGTGAFRNGASYMTSTSDFAQSSDAINSFSQGSTAGGYTARSGDTLRSVAQQLWGDSSLWYKLAEANGIQSEMALAEGQRLNVPAGISRTSHNATTFRPYDASEATGNVSPTIPKPQKKNKCGVFGQILLAAVAIAVTVIALPTGASPTIAQGALAGLAGSAASQAVGVATGIQNKFDFKGLALAGIAGGVTAGLGPNGGIFKGGNGLFGTTSAEGVFTAGASGIKNATLSAIAQGATANALTQGIGVATGLQSKFSWTGVAAAGIGSGMGSWAARELNVKPLSGPGSSQSLSNIAASTLAGTASAMANAATRSAIQGTSFGDNIMRALPDAIGNTIGSLFADAITDRSALGDIELRASEAAADPEIVVTARADGTPFTDDEIRFARSNNPNELKTDLAAALKKRDRDLANVDKKIANLTQKGGSPEALANLTSRRTEIETRYTNLADRYSQSVAIHDRILQWTAGQTVQVGGNDYVIRGTDAIFDSHRAAAIDAIASAFLVQKIVGDSWERGGAIYTADGGFKYTFQIGGRASGSEVGTGPQRLEDNQPNVRIKTVPNMVAFWHIHPPSSSTRASGGGGFMGRDGNIDFSDGDRSAFGRAYTPSRPLVSYLGGSDGSLDVMQNVLNGQKVDTNINNGSSNYFSTRRR